MRTDTELIEAFLLQQLEPEEKAAFEIRRQSDPRLRRSAIDQAKVHIAALLYGRNLRRARILAAEERSFADPVFAQTVHAIFQ